MIFVAWLIISINLIGTGLVVAWPRRFGHLFHERLWCDACHHEITVRQKFIASYEASQSLEDRQV